MEKREKNNKQVKRKKTVATNVVKYTRNSEWAVGQSP